MKAGLFDTAISLERGNPELQDCAHIIDLDGSVLMVLADGAGGRSNALAAAQTAVQTVIQHADALLLTDVDECRRVLALADEEVAKTGGETTCVFVLLTESSITGASVGDSEAW